MLITFNLRVTLRCSKFSLGRNKPSGILCNNIWFFWVNIALKSHATYPLCAIAWLLGNPNHCFRPLPLLSWKEEYTVNPLKKVFLTFFQSTADTDRWRNNCTYLLAPPTANSLRRNSMNSQKVKNDSEFSPLQLHSRSDVAFYQFRDVTVGIKRKVSEAADDFRPGNVKNIRCDILNLTSFRQLTGKIKVILTKEKWYRFQNL